LSNKTWTVTVEENPDDPEECILPFPEDMLAAVGWKEGDTIEWKELANGSWILSKKE
jgi:hypothetical protein